MTSAYAEAQRLARQAGLIIFCKNGVYRVFRNTMPRLTFIGDRVSASALLELVKRATGSKNSPGLADGPGQSAGI